MCPNGDIIDSKSMTFSACTILGGNMAFIVLQLSLYYIAKEMVLKWDKIAIVFHLQYVSKHSHLYNIKNISICV